MFLVRTAFWLTIVILLLPTDAQNQRQVYGVAKATMTDAGHFCTRNPDVCQHSKIAFEKFSKKVKFAGKLVAEFFRKETAGAPQNVSFFSPANKTNSTNTLNKDDLKPLWGLGI